MNISKAGPSLSVGPRGAKLTVSQRGARVSAGIPGSGLFYSQNLMPSAKKKSKAKKTKSEAAADPALPDPASVPQADRALVEGCRLLAAGDTAGALARLREAAQQPDGACLAGFVALKQNALDEAAQYLGAALQHGAELGQQLGKYHLRPEVELAITEEVSALLGLDERGVLLALTETCQAQGRWAEAASYLQRLSELEPDDIVVKLSLAEVLLEEKPGEAEAARQALALAQNVENDSPVHTALLLHKARALRVLGLPEAAKEILTQALRRKKGRPAELLAALHYERALVQEDAGRPEKGSADLQKAYALVPDYEDVAARLGL